MNKNKEKVESTDIVLDEEVNIPVEVKNLTIRVFGHANLRPYPNHKSAKIKTLQTNTEMEVLDIVEGSLVQGGNTWYKVEGGYVHFSQVKEI